MEPYAIRQGDTVATLAHAFAFDSDAVWNDDKNADLKKLRPNPNILFPTDVLYIPDQVDKDSATQRIVTGATNSFVAETPLTTINLKFLDPALASRACSIAELEQLTDLRTADDGSVSFSTPVTLEAVTLSFTSSGVTWKLRIGHLDPINTLSGIYQRLQGLGYLPDGVEWDESYLGLVVAALGLLRSSQWAGVDAGASSGDEGAPSSLDLGAGDGSAPNDDAGPLNPAPGAWQEDIPQDAPAQDGGGQGAFQGSEGAPSDASYDAADPSVATPESDPSASASATDPSVTSGNGLNDDGTLDDETTELLQKAFGC